MALLVDKQYQLFLLSCYADSHYPVLLPSIVSQEKADDLERVKRYAGAEQIDTIIRKVKEQERTEQQIRKYDRSYGTR